MPPRRIYTLVIIAAVIYCGVMVAPYLRSTLVRDAAVTTWADRAVAPIAGQIVSDLPAVGEIVGDDGLIATIENTLLLAEQQSIEMLHQKVVLARIRAEEAESRLEELSTMDTKRLADRDEFAAIFETVLEADISSLRAEREVVDDRVAVLNRITQRHEELNARGLDPQEGLDEAMLRLATAKARRAQIETELKAAVLRRNAAKRGIFISGDGSTPDWLRYGEFELTMETQRVSHELHQALSELAEEEQSLATAEKTLEHLSHGTVKAPPGSLIVSVLTSPEATVQAGTPIVEWVDCRVLLVDVPLPDAEAPLIDTGDPAHVILEGENRTRDATVLLVRGSAATLGRTDLAALAKGRLPGVAQAVLTLDAELDDFPRCPVGRAAYVRFPDVGLIDIIRARLRL
ncbi:HlyD family efflux transporter periplasmic adaptor subunit [Chachezhania antarctica]|uniref:HlyD family efflux transporter periplasmic adaptor subunit n=1 Tax=Chachezhania antarctica TaxID=2340860 RepID=UPI000EB547AB|nr:HlyD family secretion protein [Chachezhania antarctica]|tara:strand:- start:1894 stop:3102 length:1209 start_codon:yes stop_codon:yes gene_type:complete